MTSVLIVGCGVFGLSTALELSKSSRYSTVTCIDTYPIPSPLSAANDINKIIRTEYSDIVYTKLSLEALDMWKNEPLFKSCYENTGRIIGTPNFEPRRLFEEESIKNLRKLDVNSKDYIKMFKGGETLSENFKEFKDNNFDSSDEFKFNSNCGFADSGNSLLKVYFQCVKNGVRFIFGPSGDAIKLNVRINNNHRKIFISTKNDEKYYADKILICCGANTVNLIDLSEPRINVEGLLLGYIKLTESEYERFKNMPILFHSDIGYCFPPNKKTRLMKICCPGKGITDTAVNDFSGTPYTVPNYELNNQITKTGLEQLKFFLHKFMPSLEYHRFLTYKVCWISNSPTTDFLIDKVPGYNNVFVATGDVSIKIIIYTLLHNDSKTLIIS